jgi:hypothetical protein
MSMKGLGKRLGPWVLVACLGCGWLALPLPGQAKVKRGAETSGPEFSPPGGVYTNDIFVRISASGPAAVIRFTLDGSEPRESSPVFTNGISLTNCAVIKARVFASNAPAGPVVVQTYTLLDAELAGFSSNLPLVIVDSFGEEVGRDTRTAVSLRVIETNGGRAAITGPAEFDGRGQVALRGRSSLRYPKRSFNLRTTDALDDSLKVPLLGLPKEWDWILFAPYPDKTLMRDMLAYEISNQMGRYAPRTRFIELFVHESGGRLTGEDYLGVYALVEKIKQGKQRVNVAKLNPDDLSEPNVTGGYVVRKDHVERFEPGTTSPGGFPSTVGSSTSYRYGYPTGPGGFPADPAGFQPPYTGSIRESSSSSSSRSSSSSSRAIVTNRIGGPLRRDGLALKKSTTTVSEDSDSDLPSYMEGFRSVIASNHLYYVDPPAEEVNAVQRAWFMNYINTLDRALYGPSFRDPTNGYAAYLDPDSFIDHHLIVETTKNVDGYRFSTYYHKDRGGRLCMGPIWDWNLSLGNAGHGKQGWIAEYWLWPQLDNREYPWFRRLFEDPDFGQRYVDRFSALRKTVLATTNLFARIDGWARLLGEAQARNFKRWPILGMNVFPNHYIGNTYEDEVTWMKDWFRTRLEWIERQFVPAPEVSLGAGNQLGVSGPGTVFYTLDGSDPRAPGGEPSTSASRAGVPLLVKGEIEVMARARVDGRWSAPTRVKLAPDAGRK